MSQPNISLSSILNNLATGQTLSAWEWQYLITEELASPQRTKAFGVTPINVQEILQERSRLFQSVYPDILSLPFFISLSYQGGESISSISPPPYPPLPRGGVKSQNSHIPLEPLDSPSNATRIHPATTRPSFHPGNIRGTGNWQNNPL